MNQIAEEINKLVSLKKQHQEKVTQELREQIGNQKTKIKTLIDNL